MSEYLKPSARGMRSPTGTEQTNGRIVNPPRYAHMGGLTGPNKAYSKNNMTVQKPGSEK